MSENKIYSSKPKEFKLLALFMLISAVAWAATMMDFSNLGDNYMQPAGLTVIGLALFFLFWGYGNKNRRIVLSNDKIEYMNPKTTFSAKYSAITVVKSFRDMNKNTDNLVILTEEDTLSVSAAFFDRKLLIKCFQELNEIAKKNENIIVEDDRLWLEEKID